MTAWWSDSVSGVTESAKVPQDLVKSISSWFLAQWVSGKEESVRSNVEKKSMNLGEWSLFLWGGC